MKNRGSNPDWKAWEGVIKGRRQPRNGTSPMQYARGAHTIEEAQLIDQNGYAGVVKAFLNRRFDRSKNRRSR